MFRDRVSAALMGLAILFWAESGSAADDIPLEISPPLDPQAGLRSLTVRPGMRVELAASEPLITDPVAFDWAPDGRLWVAEMRDYPRGMDGRGKPGGRVKLLTDSDGDGRYDRSTLFLDDLPFPNGVKSWRKGVLITAAPDVLYAEDANGDGRADVREVLYAGFGEGNQQHRANGLRWGLDNWLHMANGDSGGQVQSTRTGKRIAINGRDLRVRPDDGGLETQSGQTQFGRDRDDWGNWFGGNNSNPVWHYVLDDHYLRRNPHLAPPDVRKPISAVPGAAPVFPKSKTLARFNDFAMANRFTSACSPSFYRDDLFGPEYVGNVFICEPVHNLVHREIVTPDGVSFRSERAPDERQSEFLASTDNWFRPVMCRTGPDGALWVADMYRYIIEHPEWIPESVQKRVNLRLGEDKGRIYRIVPEGRASRPLPRLDRSSVPELVAELEDVNGWRRDTAQQMLIWRADPSAAEPLRRSARESRSPLGRLHALCALDGLDQLTPGLLASAINDDHPGVRRHAVRLSEPALRKSKTPGALDPALAAAILSKVDDADPQVRLQLAYSLGEWSDAKAGEALGRLAIGGREDRYLETAIFSSIQRDHLRPVLTSLLAADSSMAGVARLQDRVLAMAAAMGDNSSLNDALQAVLPAGGPRAWDALTSAIDAIERRSRDPAASLDPKSRALAAEAFALARRRVRGGVNVEPAAVRLLGRALGDGKSAGAGADDVKLLGGLLQPRFSTEVQQAAVAALAHRRRPEAATALLDGWRSYTPALRGSALDALLSRPEWGEALANAIRSGQVQPGRIDAKRRGELLSHRNPKVKEASEAALGGALNADRRKVAESFASRLPKLGDLERGKAVFAKKCAACHRLDGIGKPVGPDLAALTDRSTDALLAAILDPNRAVEDKFIEYLAIADDGRQYRGMLLSETSASLVLVNAEGQETALPRAEIEQLASSGKSLMPEGMEQDLTPTEMADVIAYLAGRR